MTSKQLLQEGSSRLGIELSESEVALLLRYVEELKKWNRRINLVARDTDDAAIIENHFIDSLTLRPIIEQQQARSLLDVGTGAGFPGLVLAAVLPNVRFTLVEPRKKRVFFLKHIVRTLQLANVDIIAERLEAVDVKKGKTFDLVTSRAVAAPDQFLPMVKPYLERGSRAIVMIARKAVLEATKLQDAFQVIRLEEHVLPFSQAPRVLALVSLTS